MLTVGSLFAGIGGFDRGLERAGMQVRWQVENNGWCQRVLAKHWPAVPRYGDITEVDWAGVEPVDLICGGFPCQPFSAAGKRKGHTDNRYLWPEVIRCVAARRPTWCLFENVLGLASLYQYHDTSSMEGKDYSSQAEAEAHFEGICEREGQNTLALVLDDLERLGYAVKPFVISASAFDAPHIRKRIWIVAHARSERRQQISGGPFSYEGQDEGRPTADYYQSQCDGQGSRAEDVAHTKRYGLEESRDSRISKGTPTAVTDRCEWPIEPDVGRVAHGVPKRVDRLRGLGNAVVPQVVEWLGRMILTVEAKHD